MKEFLSKIEKDYDIEILFACEAGSRAWGLSGPHSDFDIRFIYRYHGLKKYLALNKAQSVLDFQTPFDCSGYDLFKAVELINKSNPGIYEWAYSPIIYQESDQFSQHLKTMIEAVYSPFSLFKHYGSLSTRNVNELSKGNYSLKKQKQLLQALRAELIRIAIVVTQTVRSPFELLEIGRATQPNLYAAYLTISEAKKNNVLLNSAEVEKIIGLLHFFMKETEEKDQVQKKQPSVETLNNWIWEIFGI